MVAPAISMILERIEDAKNRNIGIAKTIVMVGYEDKNSAYALKELEDLAQNSANNLQILTAYKDNADMPYTLPKLNAKTKKVENTKCILDKKENLIKINSLLNMKNVHIRLSGYLDLQEQLKQTSVNKVKNVSGLLSGLASYFINHRLKSLAKQGRIEAEGVSNQKIIQTNTQAE